jgi:hypothetical protein
LLAVAALFRGGLALPAVVEGARELTGAGAGGGGMTRTGTVTRVWIVDLLLPLLLLLAKASETWPAAVTVPTMPAQTSPTNNHDRSTPRDPTLRVICTPPDPLLA